MARVRSLDENHDWNFGSGKQSYLLDNEAVAQNVQTRLYEFLNDCFFNMEAGIDWIRLLGTKDTEDEIVLSCKAVILETPEVVRVNSISASVNSSRRIIIEYNIDTNYSRNFQQTAEITG